MLPIHTSTPTCNLIISQMEKAVEHPKPPVVNKNVAAIADYFWSPTQQPRHCPRFPTIAETCAVEIFSTTKSSPNPPTNPLRAPGHNRTLPHRAPGSHTLPRRPYTRLNHTPPHRHRPIPLHHWRRSGTQDRAQRILTFGLDHAARVRSRENAIRRR